MRRLLFAPFLALAGALGAASLTTTVRAESTNESADSRSTPLPAIELSVVGGGSNSVALAERVASWFRGQGTPTHATTLEHIDAALVLEPIDEAGIQIWIWLRNEAKARVFFATQDRRGQARRYLVSDVTLDGGLDELGLEHLSQVSYLSAIALWEGNAESTAREVEEGLRAERLAEPKTLSAPPSAPTSSHPVSTDAPERPRASVLTAGAEYSVRHQGPEGVAHRIGAALGYSWRDSNQEIGGQLHAALMLPRTVSVDGVTLDLRGGTFGLGLVAAKRTSERSWLFGEIGPGVDVVRYEPAVRATESLRAASANTDVRPFALGALGARLSVGDFSISCAAFVAFQLLRAHYDIEDDDERSTLFSPWLVQPGLSVSLSAEP